MTTIVYRNGVLAADTRAYSGGAEPMGSKQKIHTLTLEEDGGRISFGVSSAHPGLSEEIRNWFMKGKEADYEPVLGAREFSALEIQPDGGVYFYKDNFVPSGPLFGEYFAIGTGTEYALGALVMGADAITAVKAAASFDMWTNDVVQHIVHIEPAPTEGDAVEADPVEQTEDAVEDAEVIEFTPPKKSGKRKSKSA